MPHISMHFGQPYMSNADYNSCVGVYSRFDMLIDVLCSWFETWRLCKFLSTYLYKKYLHMRTFFSSLDHRSFGWNYSFQWWKFYCCRGSKASKWRRKRKCGRKRGWKCRRRFQWWIQWKCWRWEKFTEFLLFLLIYLCTTIKISWNFRGGGWRWWWRICYWKSRRQTSGFGWLSGIFPQVERIQWWRKYLGTFGKCRNRRDNNWIWEEK